jgi:hypothetical protein
MSEQVMSVQTFLGQVGVCQAGLGYADIGQVDSDHSSLKIGNIVDPIGASFLYLCWWGGGHICTLR